MKHDKHKNKRIYYDFYMFNNVEINLQESYFDEALCNIMNDHFCKLTLHHNSELWQTLLIRKQHELKNNLSFFAIENEIKTLTSMTKMNSAARDHW